MSLPLQNSDALENEGDHTADLQASTDLPPLKKSDTISESTCLSDDTRVSTHSSRDTHWLQLRSLLGILALALAIGYVSFSLAILIASNNEPVDSWTIQPTVYLAISAAIANSAIPFAHSQAIPSAWWYKASPGATFRALEHQWHGSTSMLHAARYARHAKSTFATTLFVA
jgi:hypothetical protein